MSRSSAYAVRRNRTGARTVLSRKGTLTPRKTNARPCALRAVLTGWDRDGRLRRDELSSDSHRPNPIKNLNREAFTQNRGHYQTWTYKH